MILITFDKVKMIAFFFFALSRKLSQSVDILTVFMSFLSVFWSWSWHMHAQTAP